LSHNDRFKVRLVKVQSGLVRVGRQRLQANSYAAFATMGMSGFFQRVRFAHELAPRCAKLEKFKFLVGLFESSVLRREECKS